MKNWSGQIRVFGDDTFTAQFMEGEPVTFRLATPEERDRTGTVEDSGDNPHFDDGSVPTSTDIRAIHRAFDQWRLDQAAASSIKLL